MERKYAPLILPATVHAHEPEFSVYSADEIDAHLAALQAQHAEFVTALQAEHEKHLRLQSSAYINGMDAITQISTHQLQSAHKLRAESTPEVIDSERSANAILTAENERLSEAMAWRVRQRDAALHITYTLCEQLTRGHKSFCECDTCLHVNAAKEAMKP